MNLISLPRRDIATYIKSITYFASYSNMVYTVFNLPDLNCTCQSHSVNYMRHCIVLY